MTRKRPFRSKYAFEFKCRFIRAGYRGQYITVTDGTKVISPFTGKPTQREIRITTKFIEGVSAQWATSLNPNQDLTLVLPQWQIQELGINDANNLQRLTTHERSRRVLRGSGVAGD